MMSSRFSLACLKALAAAALLALAGCATVANPNPRDPWEPMNRTVSEFNEGVDSMFLKPVATVYKDHVPPMMRTGVANFFGNLSDAWSSVNSLLQLDIQAAAESFMRVNVNTFLGLGGLLDVASDMNIERHREDFGQTLGRWGVPAGPYLVLPLLGPSTLRDTIALPIDRRGDPLQYADPAWRNSLSVTRGVHIRATLLRASSVLDEAALDKYSFMRDAHLQRRRAEIFEKERADPNGGRSSDGAEPPEPPEPSRPEQAPAKPPVGDVRQPQPAPAR
jgi:phospholipid-binding lipoprotein MlaA